MASTKQSRAKVLYELAKDGVEPQDPVVREQYDEFKIDVTKQALKILKERIPRKILDFNQFASVTTPPGRFLHARDLESFISPSLPTAAAAAAADEVERPHKRNRTSSIEQPDTTPNGIQKNNNLLNNNEQSAGIFKHEAPVHHQIIEMEERIRKEALELIEMVGTVKLWIQLNIPRIEDGNNFGVAIQEEAIQELSRVEDAAFSLCDGIKYHMARAKLISKVIKYPNVADYTWAVKEIDQKEWLHLKVSMIDMRNSYSMLYDLLHKNWEKVVKPRAVDGSFMVM